MVHSALVTRFATTTDYSSRNGTRIDSIGHHHAASTSLEGTLLQFQPGGREVSPNYCIEGKNIVLVVPEEYRPWTSASAVDDARSITYEIVNASGDPDWRFSADTIASVIALDIDISRRYGITPRHAMPGFWQHKDLYIWFGRSYPTACAGPSFPMDGIISATSAGLAGTAGGGIDPTPTSGGDMPNSVIARTDNNGSCYVWNLETGAIKHIPDTYQLGILQGFLDTTSFAEDNQFKFIRDTYGPTLSNKAAAPIDVAAISAAVSKATVDAVKASIDASGVTVDVDYAQVASAVEKQLADEFAAIPTSVVAEIAS